MIPLAFDLDNTLIDTREANRAAWAAVGIDDPQEYRPAREWATRQMMVAKAIVYPMHLERTAKVLPVAALLQRNGGIILTAASDATVAALVKQFPWLAFFEIYNELNLDQKVALLNCKKPGIYFDDWDVAVQVVKERTLWRTVNVTVLNR